MPIRVLAISNYRDYHTMRPEANIFIGLAAKGDYEIHVMTYPDADWIPAFEAAGIKVFKHHPEKKDATSRAVIKAYVQEHNIDIVHAFTSTSLQNTIVALRHTAVKIVAYRGYSANVQWWNPIDYFKFLSPRVDAIFCNSNGVTEMFHRQLFFDKDKAITINKGHDISWYNSYQPIDIRTELGLNPESLLFVNVANNRTMKGIPYLLKAITLLPRDMDIHLLLVGKNMRSKRNSRILKNANRLDQVHFLGFRKDALNIVAGCDCFVLSSIKGESITKSVIEAMSLGRAAIITDIPGNEELIEDEVSGIRVAPKSAKDIAQAMMRLYEDRELLKQLQSAAPIHINNNLNTATTIEKTDQLYKKLMEF